MSPAVKNLTIPQSYTDLPTTQIKLTHHPATSPSATPIVIVTLHRPGKYNAFTDTMAHELVHAFSLFNIDDRVRCIIVTGHGKMFCAGADLSSGFGERGANAREHRDGGGRVALAIHTCTKPTIAAINGSAVGVGITMTLPMSIRIAARTAKIGFVFARRGLVMEACSSFFLPRLIGWSRAMHLVTTGATYPADDKLLGDLFSEVVETAEGVMSRAIDVAEEVVGNTSVVSTFLMRELMWRGPESVEATHLLDSRVLFDLLKGADNAEGVRAFLEKRPVKFSGTMQNDAPEVWPWWNAIDTSIRTKGVSDKSKL